MAASAWIKHVKKYAKENKIEFGDALKLAAPSYKKGSTSSISSTKKMRKTRGKGKKRGGRTFRKK